MAYLHKNDIVMIRTGGSMIQARETVPFYFPGSRWAT